MATHHPSPAGGEQTAAGGASRARRVGPRRPPSWAAPETADPVVESAQSQELESALSASSVFAASSCCQRIDRHDHHARTTLPSAAPVDKPGGKARLRASPWQTSRRRARFPIGRWGDGTKAPTQPAATHRGELRWSDPGDMGRRPCPAPVADIVVPAGRTHRSRYESGPRSAPCASKAR